MKQCPHCGAEISDSASICDLCVERSVELVDASGVSSGGISVRSPSLGASTHPNPTRSAITPPSRETEYASPRDTLAEYSSESYGSTDDSSDAVAASGYEPDRTTSTDATVHTRNDVSSTCEPGRDGQAPRRFVGNANRDRKMMAIGVGVVGVSVALGLLMASSGTPSGPASGAPSPTAVTSAPARKITQSSPVANQVTATFRGRWNSTNRDWVGNQRKAVAFELPAENKVAVWQRHVQLTLVVRCVANRIDAFVFTQSAAKMEPQDGDHTVRIAFDDGAESVERWPDSDEHDALFAPDGAAFVRRLAAAQTMQFGFTPHNATPVAADFNVAGLAGVMESSAKQCGLKK